jgi:hypothetical protein
MFTFISVFEALLWAFNYIAAFVILIYLLNLIYLLLGWQIPNWRIFRVISWLDAIEETSALAPMRLRPQ